MLRVVLGADLSVVVVGQVPAVVPLDVRHEVTLLLAGPLSYVAYP